MVGLAKYQAEATALDQELAQLGNSHAADVTGPLTQFGLIGAFHTDALSQLRLSMGSNPWVWVPVAGTLHVPKPKPASAGFWKAG